MPTTHYNLGQLVNYVFVLHVSMQNSTFYSFVAVKFTDKEKEDLKNLPNKEYILSV